MTTPSTPVPPVPRRILGLDPGLQTTGYGVLEVTDRGPRVVDAGVIRSAEGRDTSDMARRVKALYDGLCEVLDEWKPSGMAVEQLYAHYEHPRTAILMAHARGVYFLAGAQRNIPVTSYAATKVKKLVTGSGRASKEQMQYAVARELNLAGPPEPHDVADALGIALCHYFATGSGIMGGARGATFTGVNMQALLGNDPDEDLEPSSEASLIEDEPQ
ncbi:Crossover junction endodeoxyribonuclease RuvC [Gemmata sp. SH-PL17]|uniref:crossover junction endodeoxyribonuclease RuvC n=1 Tax=Gemmata sp. SH-PL17 TaxID=1630693 RepID=UPI00078E26AF|nr:crossover junction endodeoxyribonuclease RuvC [Gemmata sp. SH-PL17]AMV30274.1 Crossover junction endodeoxyribonuclease RuvC [Gemmata sp. SH-PL17]